MGTEFQFYKMEVYGGDGCECTLPLNHILKIAQMTMLCVCPCVLSRFSRVQLCDPMDCSPPDSSVHGILQARILGWVAVPASRGSSNPGIKSASPAAPALRVDSTPLSHKGSPMLYMLYHNYKKQTKQNSTPHKRKNNLKGETWQIPTLPSDRS